MSSERQVERIYSLGRKDPKNSEAESAGLLCVEVALNVPRLQTLTYRVPEALENLLVPGMRVLVPLSRRRVTGYVVSSPITAPSGVGPSGATLKYIIRSLENEPALTEEMIGLTKWVAEYYICGWGEAIRAALPGMVERKSVERVRLTAAGRYEFTREAAGLGLPGLETVAKNVPLRARILDGLKGRPQRVDSLASVFGRGARREVLRLIDEGLAEKVSVEEGSSASALVRYVRLAEMPNEETRVTISRRAPRQAAVLERLEKVEGGRMLLREIERLAPGARAACAAMVKKGWVHMEDGELLSENFLSSGSQEIFHVDFTPAQRATFDVVASDIRAEKYSVTLLHGVTGSGKTEAYLRLTGEALDRGRESLILVPEIGLTPQLLCRFRSRFGDRVACLHSAYSQKRRASEWQRVRSGKASVVLGTRSAVFAPLPRIGLIVVDEEHDASYKQDEAPRYNGRDVAIVRARRAGVPIVLGSATPSLESYTRAAGGKYRLMELPTRPGGRQLPKVSLVDMRRERSGDPKSLVLLSDKLADAIHVRLSRREQTLLFLNRRGFSSVILCRNCGESVECPNCSVPLTFHLNVAGGSGRLQCHLCDLSAPPPVDCPSCRSDRVGYFGLGTERVEEAVRARFPKARIMRMDRDVVRHAGALDEILGAMRREEVDILIGTQMVAKGHDFPKITLVGVILADVGLHLPDFRAGERTFQLLTQVAGRAGRADLPGEVIVQTFRPEHYAITCARGHDYASFYKRESEMRREVGYPPYRRLARLRFEARKLSAAVAAGVWTRNFMEKIGARSVASGGVPELVFLGPAPAMLSRIRGVHRHHIILKSKTTRRLGEALNALYNAFYKQKISGSVHLVIDVNPQNLL